MKTQTVKIPTPTSSYHFKLVEVPEVPLVPDGDVLQAILNFMRDILFLSSEEEQAMILSEYLRSLRGFLRSLYALELTAFAPTLNDDQLPATPEDEEKLDRGHARLPVYEAFQREFEKLRQDSKGDK